MKKELFTINDFIVFTILFVILLFIHNYFLINQGKKIQSNIQSCKQELNDTNIENRILKYEYSRVLGIK